MAQNMPARRVSPLNNPPSGPPVVAVAPELNKTKTTTTTRVINEGRVREGGKKRVIAVEALIKCQMCGWNQKLVFALDTLPQWHRCVSCGELQPVDGYIMWAFGKGLPIPLTPREIVMRTESADRMRG